MVPAVKHLHGEPVALSDPSDQDVVRSRLCRTQWPSRKVGRAGPPAGSTAKARFFKISQEVTGICDLPHRGRLSGHRRGPEQDRSRENGTIIQKCFLHVLTIRRRPYQGLARRTASAWSDPFRPVPSRIGRSPSLPRFRPDFANFRCKTRVVTVQDGRDSAAKRYQT
jgi:hypothetical protein